MGSSEPDVPPSERTHRMLYEFVEALGKWPVRTGWPIRDMFDAAKLAREIIDQVDTVPPLPQTQEADSIETRVEKLEAVAHAPVDLLPKIDEHLRELGLLPVTPPSVQSEEPVPNWEPCPNCGEKTLGICGPEPTSPDEPLDAETARLIDAAVLYFSGVGPVLFTADSERTLTKREVLTALARDVRRPVEQARDALRESLVGAHERWAEARQALEAAEADNERLRELNSGLTRDFNAMLIHDANEAGRREAAEAQVADLEQRGAGLARMLKVATIRVAIMLGRARACDEDTHAHGVTLIEAPAWIEEQRAALDGWAKRGTP